ncbi:MAG: hypothetical protein ACK5LR_07635 [Mangrovibacterium sp.]
MTTRIPKISCRVKVNEINSVAQAVLNKKSLLTVADEYLTDLFLNIEETQVLLNNTVNFQLVRSNMRKLLADMRISHRSFYRLIDTYASMTTFSGTISAQTILAVLKKHHRGIVRSSNQMHCHSHITALLADLESVQPSIESLMYASGELEKLKEAQQLFISEYASYKNERTIQLQNANGTALKDKLLQLFNEDLRGYLNFMTKASPEDYEELSTAVAAIIRDRNIYIRRRRITGEDSEETID